MKRAHTFIMASVAMSQSPISDSGYGSSTSTPWLEKEDCERFADERDTLKHTLLQMDAHAEERRSIESASRDPGSPSPPPSQYSSSNLNSHQQSSSSNTRSMFAPSHSSKPSLSTSRKYGHELNASISSRRAAAGILPLSITTLSPPSIRLDLPAPSTITSFYDSGTYWLYVFLILRVLTSNNGLSYLFLLPHRTLYFFFNLSLTLYNKFALVSFPFPFSLTCIHSLAAFIGSYFCYSRGYFTRVQSLGLRETLILVAFSSLYTINIAVSNLSLNLVTVPLHQVVRSTTPLFTIVISILMFGKSYLFQTYMSLVPVVIGVCLAT